MKETTRKSLTGYAVCIAIALTIAGSIAVHQGFDWALSIAMNCRHLSDGLFVAGVVFTGLGLLTWVSTTGFFDMFSFAVKRAAEMLMPWVKLKDRPNFYEYKMEKEAKRKKPLTTILFTGLGLIAASLVCLMLYYKL